MMVDLDCVELRYASLRISNAIRHGRLVEAIRRDGQQSPALVIAGDADNFVLIDGYARYKVLREIGVDTLLAFELAVSEDEALILAHRLESKRRRTALEEAWLIIALIDQHGLQRNEVATRLGRSRSWISRRIALVRDLPQTVQDAVKAGFVPSHAAGTFLVPLSRVNKSHCAELVKNLGRQSTSSRQVERLYRGYKESDDEGRQRIVEQPRLFLQASAAAEPKPIVDKGDPAAPLIDDLEAICGISRRARRRIHDGLLSELDAARRAKVSRQATISELVSQSLFEMLRLPVEGK
mgnify:FL=1